MSRARRLLKTQEVAEDTTMHTPEVKSQPSLLEQHRLKLEPTILNIHARPQQPAGFEKTFLLHSPYQAVSGFFSWSMGAFPQDFKEYFNMLVQKNNGVKELFYYNKDDKFFMSSYEDAVKVVGYKTVYVLELDLSWNDVKNMLSREKYYELLPYVKTIYKHGYGTYIHKVKFDGVQFVDDTISSHLTPSL